MTFLGTYLPYMPSKVVPIPLLDTNISWKMSRKCVHILTAKIEHLEGKTTHNKVSYSEGWGM
jgi:hypothetical protein